MSTQVRLYVTYQQVSVFDPALPSPFNSWTDTHVMQGFSWRSGSVSFGTLDPDGYIELEIAMNAESSPTENVIRAIVVPFDLPAEGNVEIATLTESKILALPKYVGGILFEAGIGGRRDQYKITFIKGKRPEPMVLIADAELDPPATI